jgi:hypothetical protein
MNEQIQTLLSHFYGYAKDKLGFDKDANIRFVMDEENSKNPLGMTAHYNPDSMEVTVYTSGRHPKDVLRSVAHELVHHRQNCQGKMDNTGPTEPGYAQNDSHLRGLEEEAYLEGNMCFRDWEDTYKANQEVKTIYESVIKTFTKEKLKMSTKEEMRNIVREAVSRVLTQNKVQEMDYEDDPYMDELEKEFPFLKDDPEMGGRAPADVQAAMDDEMPMGMEDEDEMMEMAGCPHCDGNAPRSECICGKAMEEEVVAEGDEMSRTITQIETIGDVVNGVIGMIEDPEAIERLERVDQMITILLAQMQGVDEATTDKHDDNPALTGDQKDELPDHLQKAIIDAEEEEVDEAIEDEIQSDTDRYGDMKHIIPGVRFTGDIETDVRAMEENEELADWLYGELGSGDVITDSEGRVEYAGADVQDLLDTDFYTQMRSDARTISEDWNRNFRSKRSALLNERLMKAWKLG